MNSYFKYLILFSITLALVFHVVCGLFISGSKTYCYDVEKIISTATIKSDSSKDHNVLFDSNQESDEEVDEIEFGTKHTISVFFEHFHNFLLKSITIKPLVNNSFLHSIKSLISLEIISPPPRLYWI